MANNPSPTRIPLILTRPRPASEAFFAALPDPVRDHFEPIFSPLIDIVTLGATAAMTFEDGAIFTSANGVHAAPDGQGRVAFCVGAATWRAAKERGWAARQSGTDADTLVAALMSAKPKQRLFHLSGLHTRGNVAGRLNAAGLNVENIALYDQRLCDLTERAAQVILQEDPVVVPLFSPRTAAQFCAVAPLTATVHVIALSRAVADAVGPTPLASLLIAKRPDAEAMAEAIGGLIQS